MNERHAARGDTETWFCWVEPVGYLTEVEAANNHQAADQFARLKSVQYGETIRVARASDVATFRLRI